MVPDKQTHQNQTISNTCNNHQINDKNFATKAIKLQTSLQVIKNRSHNEATLSFLTFVFK